MHVMYKSKEQVELLLPFVDESQMQSISWMALIGMELSFFFMDRHFGQWSSRFITGSSLLFRG